MSSTAQPSTHAHPGGADRVRLDPGRRPAGLRAVPDREDGEHPLHRLTRPAEWPCGPALSVPKRSISGDAVAGGAAGGAALRSARLPLAVTLPVGDGVGPGQRAGRQPQPGGGVGLDDVRRGAAGVPRPLDALDGDVRRHPQLHRPAGHLLGQPAGRRSSPPRRRTARGGCSASPASHGRTGVDGRRAAPRPGSGGRHQLVGTVPAGTVPTAGLGRAEQRRQRGRPGGPQLGERAARAGRRRRGRRRPSSPAR